MAARVAPPISTSTSASDLTALHDYTASNSPTATINVPHAPPKVAKTGLFTEPGTIPLPDHGHHRLGVAFEDVTVYGSGGTRKTVEGLEVSLLNMWNVWRFASKLFNIKTGPTRPIISNFYGVVPAGETLLVLGRPGSGCSTLLRAITNQRDSFVRIDGDFHYGQMDAKEASKYYKGDIIFNSEEDIHTPILTVTETLHSALELKHPRAEKTARRDYGHDLTNRLLHAFGMPHTARTKVGDNFVRGVSGGERKRVSLAETMATNAAITAWDNSVRGLDSAVALHYQKTLKELALSTGQTHITSIYQASQETYNLYDRVCVLYEGQMVFMGRAEEAQQYFEEQGWYKNPRQTTPDFLTSCTSVTERKIREDFHGNVPQTPQEMADYFRRSPYWTKLQNDIAEYKAYHSTSDDTNLFRSAVAQSKHRFTGKANAYKSNFGYQCWAMIKKQLALQKADPRNIVIRVVSNGLNALFVGSVMFKPTADASGSFAIAGGLFFAILYFTIFAFGEIPATVNSRPLLIKHRTMGFYHPAAVTIAMCLADVPLYVLQTLIFSSLFYFLVGLNPGAKYFFTFWFVCFTNYSALSVLYRMIGSWSPNLSVAVRYGGFALSLVLTCAGFILPPPLQLGWARWMRRIAPPAYALEALMANEFRTRNLQCGATDLIPNGAGYDNLAYQVCSIPGAVPGQNFVSGDTYILDHYGFKASHIWRNVGICWAMYAIYSAMIVIGSALLVKDTGSATAKVFKRGATVVEVNTPLEKVDSKRHQLQAEGSLARQASRPQHSEKAQPRDEEGAEQDFSEAPVFTFQNVRYTVQVDGKDKVLLNGVTALVEPGKLTALMGASGAGKTTLLDTISQRKTTGVVEGEYLIDGKPLSSDFSRRAGFAQQGDVHEPFATVRECLQFSALMRQTGDYTREQKLAYAEEIIELLELQPIADAIVGGTDSAGGGLGVEERKRLTIGVELAARPDFLLFLDEPTSGLDSQAAYEIVRFLRKIASAGLAVVCVVHQPSGDLFEMFDSIVLLAPGGKTVYAGPTGKNASTVTDYFARYGAPTAPDANPAESIIETVAPVGGSKIDWPQYWRDSPEAQAMLARIAEVSARSQNRQIDNGQAPEKTAAFAASMWEQIRELTKRNFRAQLRDGSYYTTKLSSMVFFGMFSGFYMYKLTPSVDGIQSMSLALLTLTQVVPPVALDIGINYIMKMDIFLARERNGIYSWQALVASLIITETPILVVGFNLLFFCYHWTIGFNSSPGVGALAWLCWMIMSFFLSTFGVLLGAVSPTPMTTPFILATIWVLFSVMSWALVPWPSTMSTPYHVFFSWLDPIRYFWGALMGDSLRMIKVTCTEKELVTFNIPSGQTCAAYAANFLQTAAGYLANPDATGSCQYCSMSSGKDYLAELGYNEHQWRDWGIFIVFSAFNVVTVFVATWIVRIRPLYK